MGLAGIVKKDMGLAKGLAYCGGCGAQMVLHRAVRNGTEYLSYTCSDFCGGVRMIRAEELDRAICDYLRALTAEDVRKQLDKALTDYVKARSEESRKVRERRLKELRDIAHDRDLPSDICSVLKACCLQLELVIPEYAQPVRKKLSAAEYFCEPVTESIEADPEGMRRAAQWYIQRVTVRATNIEFHSTFDEWLRKAMPELSPAWIGNRLE